MQKQLSCLAICIKVLLFSRPSPLPVPTSLQPWPYIIFQTQCSSSFFFLFPTLSVFFSCISKNKALLMTVGSQGPAGAWVLESAVQWKGFGGGAPPPPSLPPLLSQVRIEGQEGLMCCCCTEVWAITMAASTSNTKVHFFPPQREVCLWHVVFFYLSVQLHFKFLAFYLWGFSFDSLGRIMLFFFFLPV